MDWVTDHHIKNLIFHCSHIGPADIDILAALGDFTIAGTGALSNTSLSTLEEYPEVSFVTGDSELSEWGQLILRKMNPKIDIFHL